VGFIQLYFILHALLRVDVAYIVDEIDTLIRMFDSWLRKYYFQ